MSDAAGKAGSGQTEVCNEGFSLSDREANCILGRCGAQPYLWLDRSRD